MKLQALGIDLAKNVFHLVGLDSRGQLASDAPGDKYCLSPRVDTSDPHGSLQWNPLPREGSTRARA
jgi:hypothetical protein